jgi:hypothetical protein
MPRPVAGSCPPPVPSDDTEQTRTRIRFVAACLIPSAASPAFGQSLSQPESDARAARGQEGLGRLAFAGGTWLPDGMAKTITMLALMAALLAFSTACFGLFQGKSDSPSSNPCAGLVGQEKIDCEERERGEDRLM